ncbi:MAG: GNAT family N-acetyltransferase [Lachnospiraceae bacterium]|nr:GNAT family N-acetyltransferase [Lachnospiraceae bacterium]
MNRDSIQIRRANLNDAQKFLDIYSYYVINTAITFEYEVPSLEEFRRRMSDTLSRYPYLAAERNGEIVGYAYAGLFHSRAAYQWNVETSIYVKQDCRGGGVGKALYECLERILKAQNILNLNACIAYPVHEDEYLTQDSVQFHEKMDYQMVGRFHHSGYKFGRWYDMVWMEKLIGEHSENPVPVTVFPDLKITSPEQLE